MIRMLVYCLSRVSCETVKFDSEEKFIAEVAETLRLNFERNAEVRKKKQDEEAATVPADIS